MKSKRDGFFWVSYTDVMITLFFVMLAIAAISVFQLNAEKERVKKEKEATEQELKQIKRIQQKVNELKEDPNFDYNDKIGRFEVKRDIRFDLNSDQIKPEYEDDLMRIGRRLKELIDKESTERTEARKNGTLKSNEAAYLFVIEGSASRIGNDALNFPLSYRRGLALYNFWKAKGIDLKVPQVSDVQISGSGVYSSSRAGGGQEIDETTYQSFKIQVVPLIPEVKSIK